MKSSPEENREDFWSNVLEIFSKTVHEAGPYATASYALIGAIVLLGLLGYFLDGWLGTSPWLFLVGILLGLVVGFYEIAKVVFKK